ncbi:MAG: hypothetical protein K2I74_02900 [Treponemataceae bacterium]|nr:hypothetical protein [Treponemataceae bacterium]
MSEKHPAERWYEIKEKHHAAGLALTFALLKILPSVAVRAIAFPVGFFYWLLGKKTRAVSRQYLRHVNAVRGKNGLPPLKVSTLKHIVSFAITLTEKLEVWAGKFSFRQIHFQDDDTGDLVQNLENGRGVMLFISHVGNSELLRGLASAHETGVTKPFVVNSIINMSVTAGFNALLKKINADATMNIISANDISPDTMIMLQEKVAGGEMVVIAGDRTSAHTQTRFVAQDFLGEQAPFAYGAYLLCALLNVPTYFVFGIRQKDVSLRPQYDFYAHKNPVTFDCGRKEREERIRQTVAAYAHELECHCLAHPYQWYNFFDFWAMP